jgi:hypothetical protein
VARRPAAAEKSQEKDRAISPPKCRRPRIEPGDVWQAYNDSSSTDEPPMKIDVRNVKLNAMPQERQGINSTAKHRSAPWINADFGHSRMP